MSTKIAFSSRCPKGHNVDHSFSRAELKEHIAAGRLTAVCPHCGGREYVVAGEQLDRIIRETSTTTQKDR